jgi:hypothetical protein
VTSEQAQRRWRAEHAWATYAVAALLGLAVRVPLAVYNFAAGYEVADISLINIDGIGYVRKAVGAQESYTDLNWLYEGMNSLMLAIGGSEHYLYLQMSLLNVLLSLLLPLAAWPAFSVLTDDSAQRAKARALVSLALLLWPTSIWISTQNMKDTMLALLLCAFTSASLLILARGATAWRAGVVLAVSAWLILSLRVYALAIVGLGFGVALALRWRRFPRLVAGAAGVLLVLSLGPLRPVIATVLRPENAFLFNPEVVNAINEQRLGESEDFLQVNSSFSAVAVDAIRAPLNPYPSLQWRTGYDGLLMVRTVIVALLFAGWLWWLLRWRSPFRPFFLVSLVGAWLFFAVGRSYSGPRQIYSTIEPVMIIAGALALADPRAAPWWPRSAALGAVGLLILLVYTTLVDASTAALR